ncbi:hypothetical protein [Fibrella aquatica]
MNVPKPIPPRREPEPLSAVNRRLLIGRHIRASVQAARNRKQPGF